VSNRSVLEFNHDHCPTNDAECLALGRAMQAYMRGADVRELPPGVRRYDYRHHSDPDHAATLAGLRDGSLVAVPREPTLAQWKQMAIYVDRDPDGGFMKNVRVAWPLFVSALRKLAAAQEPTHEA
jgi:hypothetical protein